MKRVLATCILIGVIAAAVWYVFVIAPRHTPWEETGTISVLYWGVPTTTGATQELSFTVSSVRLIDEEGSEVPLTVLGRDLRIHSRDASVRALEDASIHTGSWGGVRFSLKDVELKNSIHEASPQQVSLLNSTFVLPTAFELGPDEHIVLLLGFETAQAVHDADGLPVYLPVIRTELRRGATVLEDDKHNARVEGGTILESTIFGTAWDGSLRKNYRARAE